MRLTDSIMRASDEAMSSMVGNALTLAAAGRFGLLPCTRPFLLSFGDINAESVEIKALDCLGITKDGHLIDIQFDTAYTSRFNSTVPMPTSKSSNELYLTVNIHPDLWEKTIDGYEEPFYDFTLVGANSPIANNALPIAHLVDTEYGGWHVDEEGFVPPCLFVSSHQKYQNLLSQFLQCLSEIEAKISHMPIESMDETFHFFWPILQQIMIDTDKGRDLLTPMTLLGNIQKLIAAFTTACTIDRYLQLDDADTFRQFALRPYNIMDAYATTNRGLNLCLSISRKIDGLEPTEPEKPKPINKIMAPSIANEHLKKTCNRSVVSIPVINSIPGATVMFSVDGGTSFKPAMDKGQGAFISIRTRFKPERISEPDQEIVVKLKAILNGDESDVSTFTLVLRKDYKTWIQI